MKTVPSLNVVYTDEEGYVTADVAKDKGSASRSSPAPSSARCSAAARTSPSGSRSSPSSRFSASTSKR